MAKNTIAIIMAAKNGAPWIREQIESIRNQDCGSWVLYVRDDGSTDQTYEIVQECCKEDCRIHLVLDGFGHLGVVKSFDVLMRRAYSCGAEYLMFSDQDDIWLPDKISSLLLLMQHLEKCFPSKPILVYSDLRVVDESLRMLSPSFMKYNRISHIQDDPLRHLLAHNFVTGNASLLNRTAWNMVLPVPKEAIMHDWWSALVTAASGGKIGFLEKPTVLYRQHQRNFIGARSRTLSSWIQQRRFARTYLRDTTTQAKSLLAHIIGRYPELLEHHQAEMMQAYANLLAMSRKQRFATARKWGFKRQGWVCQLSFIIHLFFE